MSSRSPIFRFDPYRQDRDYSTRQQAVLAREIPVEEIRTGELTVLIKKAMARQDEAALSIAQELYEIKTNPDLYEPRCTYEEAKEILQSLTPWPIKWGDAK